MTSADDHEEYARSFSTTQRFAGILLISMQFQVPQFIEVEDKIFGPLTFKQFIYLGGGLGTAYIFWRILPLMAAAPLMVAVVGLAAALAFMQYNGRPFILAMESAFFYLVRGKLYLWDNSRKIKEVVETKVVSDNAADLYVPKLSQSKLHDLAWSLDIQERIAAGVANQQERGATNRPVGILTAKDAMVR